MTTNFSPRMLSSLVSNVVDWGETVDSERGVTIELEDQVLHMDNPRDRVCTEEWRKMNIGFAIVDALSHIVGDDKLNPLTNFVPGFAAYSTNGRTIDGAYGKRIYSGDQLQQVIQLLRKNPMTRRAVMSIYMGVVDLNGGGGLNTPCTLNFHFLVRDGKLNMKAMMRSNDVILGLTNDVFTFTMLHEYVSIKTNIPLGSYSHFDSSLHLYESDLKKYSPDIPSTLYQNVMWDMPADFNPFQLYLVLSLLHETTIDEALEINLNSQYERNLYFTAASVYFRKNPRVNELVTEIQDECLQHVVKFWTERREHETKST